MHNPYRRKFIASTLAITSLALPFAGTATAQAGWPAKEIHLVVPWPAGGESDTYARALAQDLSIRLKQPVIVENRAGATGAIGIRHVARSKPDGYTVLFGNTTSVVGNVVSSLEPVQFDPVTDFTPIAAVVEGAYVFWAHPSLGVRNFEEFLARARDKSKAQLAFGITGSGALSELSVEQLARHYKLDLLKVPYKGSAPQLADLIAGHTQVGTADPSVALGHFKEGRLVPLLVIGNARLPELPDVPTRKELGITEPDLTIWNGLLVPAETPKAIIDALTQAVGESVRSPVYKGVADGPGRRALFIPGAEFGERIKRELAERRRYKALVDSGK
jgi:tripartite-type tricarboxylate transporter receptor subunit TctC